MKLSAILGKIRGPLGPLKEVKATKADGVYDAEFERGSLRVHAHLDKEGHLDSLWLSSGEPKAIPFDEALGALRGGAEKLSAIVLRDGAEKVGIDADTPLAVGSAFKLAILAALRDKIEKKKAAWTDVALLRPETKSLPSGTLQTWPEGAPLTLYSLAARMISESDNTATDMLLERLGREAIEPYAPRNKPFLETREVFILKTAANASYLERYQKADEAGRRALLKEVDKLPLPDISKVHTEPTALDVEWYFTPRELCALMKKVHDLPLTGINAGPAGREDWDRVAYKGGSEPGVLNLTTWVEKDGHAYCVAATWNSSKALDEDELIRAYKTVLVSMPKPEAKP
jgi:beta-lactamase class A